MSYPPYGSAPGGGYPPMGGYPQGGGGFTTPGYPPIGGQPQFAMPTPESANAAAYSYGGAPGGGLPYAAQPFGPQPPSIPPSTGGYPPPSISMPSMPSAPLPTYNQPGYPPQAPPSGYPPLQTGQGFIPPPTGYGSAPAPGGYPPDPYSTPHGNLYPTPTTSGYGHPSQGSLYGPPGQYGSTPPGSQPGAPPYTGGYGAPSTPSAPGYGQGIGYSPPATGHMTGNVPSAASYHIREEGTLKPYPGFNAESDAQRLRKAMKGFGTDEKAIIDVLGYRSNDQRQYLKSTYKTCFGRDLAQDLKSELSGRFEDTALALLYRPEEYDAYELRRAMKGLGTDEAALIEILCTRNNAQIHALTRAYKEMYGRKLEQDIISETSGHFRRLLVSMCAGGRLEHQPVDFQKAHTDAQRVYQAGEKRWGTDESTFNMVLASQSYEQLKAVFDAYIKVSGRDIEQAIKSEMSGDLATGMLTIVRAIRNKHGYFSERLYHSMKGLGTNDTTLIRVIVSRCEVDMKQIKQEFARRYGKTLESFVRDDTSGDYRNLLMALISDK